MRDVLDRGATSAIWLDADVLIFANFAPRTGTDTFGRELWVQPEGRRLRAYRKIHNAWLQFSAGSSTLDFYADRAQTLLDVTHSHHGNGRFRRDA